MHCTPLEVLDVFRLVCVLWHISSIQIGFQCKAYSEVFKFCYNFDHLLGQMVFLLLEQLVSFALHITPLLSQLSIFSSFMIKSFLQRFL